MEELASEIGYEKIISYHDGVVCVESGEFKTNEDIKRFVDYCIENGYPIKCKGLTGYRALSLEEVLEAEREQYEKRVEWAKERFSSKEG